MAEHATNPQTVSELESALNQLESSLVDAGRSVAVVRRNVAQLATLVDVVRELELTMNRARQNLGMTAEAPSPQPLRPVLPPEPAPQPAPEPAYEEQPIEEPQASYEPEPEPPMTEEPPAAETIEPVEEVAEATAGETSHCLRLGVASKVGSLDLKAVDGSVNENPAVVDVALLDYDGRKATLKLWINGAADPVGVRDALLGSLRRRLGDEGSAEVEIDFEGAA
jgi:hypothetical protein